MIAVVLSKQHIKGAGSVDLPNAITARLCLHPTQIIGGSPEEKFVGNLSTVQSVLKPLLVDAVRRAENTKDTVLFVDLDDNPDRFQARIHFVSREHVIGAVVAEVRKELNFITRVRETTVYLHSVTAITPENIQDTNRVLEMARYLAFEIQT